MQKLLIPMVLIVAVVVIMASLVVAQEKAKVAYIGDKTCKMCHLPQYTAWSATKHAKAYAALKPEEQKKAECAGCHITGKTAADSLIANVTCEACHGAGSEYKKTMISKAKWNADPAAAKKTAMAAGLVYPVAADCMKCHKKEGNPNYKEFNFETMKGLVHPVKAETPAKK